MKSVCWDGGRQERSCEMWARVSGVKENSWKRSSTIVGR